MSDERLANSLPPHPAAFIGSDRIASAIGNRFQEAGPAPGKLPEHDVEAAHRDAATEADPAWEGTAGDGLGDETW